MEHLNDNFKVPSPGTRFTYTRYTHWISQDITEQWAGAVVKHWVDSIGEHVVEAIRDDGETETFWNGSFAGTPTESIEIHE